MHGLNFPLLSALVLLPLLLAGLALVYLAAFPLMPQRSKSRTSLYYLCLLILISISLLALSGCGTQPSPGKQPPLQVPAELMKPPAKPILLAPSLPASTSTLPSPTKPPTPPPAEKTERAISA